MPRVVHFEIHAEDPDRAIEFYESIFDWKFTKYEGGPNYWLIVTGADSHPGINGGLMPRRGAIDGEAVIAYVCTIDVGSVDDYAALVESKGGRVVVPKFHIPGVGWIVYCKDTEGNIFGMIEGES